MKINFYDENAFVYLNTIAGVIVKGKNVLFVVFVFLVV